MANVISENEGATVKAWFLRLPGHHPFWDCYMLSIASLRDMPDVEPAKKWFAEATHEIILVALNPDYDPHPEKRETWAMLRPINYAHQVAATDEAAINACEIVIGMFEAGSIPAEPQGWQGAREVFAHVIDNRIAQED